MAGEIYISYRRSAEARALLPPDPLKERGRRIAIELFDAARDGTPSGASTP